MYKPTCYTSSSIGPCPTLCDNFLAREQITSITWDDGFNFNDQSWFKTYHQCEPPDVLDIRDRLIAVHEYYDLILAFDERVLKECPNSVFLTESACSWLPRKYGAIDPLGRMRYSDGTTHKNPVVMNYEGCDIGGKRFSVSFLTSSKCIFPGHILRQEVYDKLPKKIGELEVWKHKSPPIISNKRDILEPYMFSIVPENSRHNGYYTEKVIDCFIAKTIPLYWGCTNMCNYFNMDGIVQFDNYEDLSNKLKSLTPEFYYSKKQAIEDNFCRAMLGVHQWDLIENAITEGIEKKLVAPPKIVTIVPPQELTRRPPRPLRRTR